MVGDVPPRSARRRLVGGIGAVLLALVALGAAAWAGGGLLSGSTGRIGYTAAFLNGTVTVTPTSAIAQLPPSFWGGNLGPNTPVSGPLATLLARSPIGFARWPGGAAGDGINYTTGLVTNLTGAVSPAVTNLSAFVTWCRSAGCHALLELPGEIDDPATAAYDVAYTERTLGFRPDLWAIGNEPALWSHFGAPWSRWSGAPTGNATPATYAALVHAYISAVRAVDPTARFLGLDGVGTGGYGDASWIRATLAENGPNVSAVGIHVYPAGSPPFGGASLNQFYRNLTGSRSLPARIASARAAVESGCPGCGPVPVLVTELNVGVLQGSYLPYATGFPEVPAVAALLAQGMAANLTGAYLSQLETPSAGAWLSAAGTVHPLAQLYTEILPDFPGRIVGCTVVAGGGGLVAVAGTDAAGRAIALLVANLNTTTGYDLTLSHPPTAGSGWAWAWDGRSSSPVLRSLATGWPGQLTLPPVSIAFVESNLTTPTAIAGVPGASAPLRGGAGPTFGPVGARPLSGGWPGERRSATGIGSSTPPGARVLEASGTAFDRRADATGGPAPRRPGDAAAPRSSSTMRSSARSARARPRNREGPHQEGSAGPTESAGPGPGVDRVRGPAPVRGLRPRGSGRSRSRTPAACRSRSRDAAG